MSKTREFIMIGVMSLIAVMAVIVWAWKPSAKAEGVGAVSIMNVGECEYVVFKFGDVYSATHKGDCSNPTHRGVTTRPVGSSVLSPVNSGGR